MKTKSVGQKDNIIKLVIKKYIADLLYKLYMFHFLKMKHDIKVMSIDETIDELLNSNKSLVRFGDGEIAMLRGVNLKLQKTDPQLSEDIKRILHNDNNDLLVAIQDIFDGVEQYVPQSQIFWKDHLMFYRKYYDNYCISSHKYASTSFSRCYLTIRDKSKCAIWFDKIKNIWNDKDIVIIEGTATHNGVGNDLFDKAKSIRRIIGPPQNAYNKVDLIYKECLKFDTKYLFIISLGAASKPLTESLCKNGYRAIDIGHLDMEYEWFLNGVMEKQSILKHSIIGEEANREAGYDKYLDEIIKIIK